MTFKNNIQSLHSHIVFSIGKKENCIFIADSMLDIISAD